LKKPTNRSHSIRIIYHVLYFDVCFVTSHCYASFLTSFPTYIYQTNPVVHPANISCRTPRKHILCRTPRPRMEKSPLVSTLVVPEKFPFVSPFVGRENIRSFFCSWAEKISIRFSFVSGESLHLLPGKISFRFSFRGRRISPFVSPFVDDETALVVNEPVPPKNGEIALWLPTNRSIPYMLVLAGSGSTMTEITEFIYFSLL